MIAGDEGTAAKAGETLDNSLSHRFRYGVLPVLLVLLGVAIILAPVVLTTMKNAEQLRVADSYSRYIADADTAVVDYERHLAHEWNASEDFRISGDPWMIEPDKTTPAYRRYVEQLDLNPVMARIKVPSVAIDLPVYHGTDEVVLSRGVGHLFGTALPVGGIDTHSVLTGHTGISTSTFFDNLVDATIGEHMVVETLGEQLVYEIAEIRIVLPADTDDIRPVAGQDLLTLITCTPYGVNSHRLLVTGERVFDVQPEDLEADSPWPVIQWWMYLALALSIALILALSVWLWQKRKKK